MTREECIQQSKIEFNNDIDNTIIKFQRSININRWLLAAITLWIVFLTMIGGLENPINLIFIVPITLSIHAIKSTVASIQTIRELKL